MAILPIPGGLKLDAIWDPFQHMPFYYCMIPQELNFSVVYSQPMFFFLYRAVYNLYSTSVICNNVGNLQSFYNLHKKDKKQEYGSDINICYSA